jgi:hypothetical protein
VVGSISDADDRNFWPTNWGWHHNGGREADTTARFAKPP